MATVCIATGSSFLKSNPNSGVDLPLCSLKLGEFDLIHAGECNVVCRRAGARLENALKPGARGGLSGAPSSPW